MRSDQHEPRVGIFFVYQNRLLVGGTRSTRRNLTAISWAMPAAAPDLFSGETSNGTRMCHERSNTTRCLVDVWGTRRRKQSFTSFLIRASWRIRRWWIGCQGRSKRRPLGRSKREPLIRIGRGVFGEEGALERSGRGPSSPKRVGSGRSQRSEGGFRLRRLCLRR